MGIERWRNPDGTYDGARALADISGLSREEVLWTFNRMKELKARGMSAEEYKAQVAREVKDKPWLK